jgi:chromosome segregation ATPase
MAFPDIPPVPPAPDPVPTPPAPTPAPAPAENYEARYKGLQRSYDTLRQKTEALEAERTQALSEAETLKQTDAQRQATLDRLQREIDAAKAEKETLSAQMSSQAIVLTRKNLILKDYPDLAQFEANGQLPEAKTEEEMKTTFTKFRETFSAAVAAAVQQKVTGAAPAPTSNLPPASMSKEEVYARLTRLAGSRDGTKEKEEYNQLIRQWDDLNKP